MAVEKHDLRLRYADDQALSLAKSVECFQKSLEWWGTAREKGKVIGKEACLH